MQCDELWEASQNGMERIGFRYVTKKWLPEALDKTRMCVRAVFCNRKRKHAIGRKKRGGRAVSDSLSLLPDKLRLQQEVFCGDEVGAALIKDSLAVREGEHLVRRLPQVQTIHVIKNEKTSFLPVTHPAGSKKKYVNEVCDLP